MLEKLLLIYLVIGINLVLHGQFWKLPSYLAWVVTGGLVILIIRM